jgi:hypothetical protein
MRQARSRTVTLLWTPRRTRRPIIRLNRRASLWRITLGCIGPRRAFKIRIGSQKSKNLRPRAGRSPKWGGCRAEKRAIGVLRRRNPAT